MPENAEPPKRPMRLVVFGVMRKMLPPYTGGSADTVLGMPFYDSPHYEKPWFQNTFGRLYSAMRRVDDAYYWVVYRRTRKGRFHVVYTDLKPGYHDVDEVMFRACFALLGRFVERELCPLEEGDGREGHRGYGLHSASGSDEQAIDLWLWYIQDLAREEAEQEADYGAYIRDKGYSFLDDLKDEKLRALIDMRRTLWT